MGLLSLVGLTLNASSFAGVVKGMALFPLLLVASNVGIVYFVQNPISDQLIAALTKEPDEDEDDEPDEGDEE